VRSRIDSTLRRVPRRRQPLSYTGRTPGQHRAAARGNMAESVGTAIASIGFMLGRVGSVLLGRPRVPDLPTDALEHGIVELSNPQVAAVEYV